MSWASDHSKSTKAKYLIRGVEETL